MGCQACREGGGICGAPVVAVDLPRGIMVCAEHRRKVETPKGWVAVGELCWFTKSMRLCRLLDVERGGRLTLEIMDSGKEITATVDGIMPNAAFSSEDS